MYLRRRSAGQFALTLAMAAVLASCGGGSPGGGSSSTLTGFAAKGTLKNATVTAYGVKADGTVSAAPVVPAVQTNSDGTYTLHDLTPGQYVLVQVTPNALGTTRHADEITKVDAALSSTFVLSAVVLTDAAGTTASVTPFSHQIVVAAQNAGGLTAANIASAQATVEKIIGFNPVSMAKNDGSTTQAKQLQILLATVSQMAFNGDLGCPQNTTASAACVTRRLAEATTAGKTTLSLASEGDVSSVLAAAIPQAMNALAVTDTTLMSGVLSQLTPVTPAPAPAPAPAQPDKQNNGQNK